MFATDTERCPGPFFKLYLSERLECLQNNGPFYLSEIVNPKAGI